MAQQHSAHGQNGHGSHGHDSHHEESHGSLKSYIIGFLLSIVLTIIPIVVVMNDLMERTGTMLVLLVTAVLQFLVQLVFFMHLKEENKPRFNLMALILGLLIVLVIVVGSIWIMTYNKVAV